jgi:hypothetical protein
MTAVNLGSGRDQRGKNFTTVSAAIALVALARLFGATLYIDIVETPSRFVPCNGQFGSGSINMPAGSLSWAADS